MIEYFIWSGIGENETMCFREKVWEKEEAREKVKKLNRKDEGSTYGYKALTPKSSMQVVK